MKKRLIGVLLTIVLICMLMAGCGNSSKKSGSNEQKDDFPKDVVTITVAYSAGGSSDKLARMLQPYLKEALGVNIVVENQNGAGGQIAAEGYNRGAQDGYQLLAINIPGLYYTIAFQDASYDYDTFIPLWVESYDPIIMLTLKDAEYDNLAEFIDMVKANPGKFSVGYVANSGQQATALWLQKNLDLDVNMVSYDGGSDASAALLGGHIDVIFSDAYARMDIAEEAKALGIGTVEPNEVWTDVLSFNEQLEPYNVQMPSDEFQARIGCYMVSKSFKEDYPERYDALVKALETACSDEKYIQTLKDANLYPSMVLASGTDYEEAIEISSNEVKDTVIPLFK